MVDPDIAAWILEFLFRQRNVSLGLAVELFLALPLPSPLPPRLSAALLFHRLSADVSSRSVSLRTLDTLSFIHRLYPSPSLLPAFAAVAVECTVAPLRQRTLSSSSTDSDAEFFDAVNKIWNFRMDDLERSESAGLVSPALREARKEMETAVVDPALREELARRETKEAALNALRVCLAAAGNEMGPTFLESAAEAIISRDCEDMAGNNIDRSLAALGDKMRTLYSSWSEPVETGKEVLITPSKTDTSRTTVPVELVDRSKNIKLTGPNVEDHQMGASATMTGQRKENLDDKNCNNELRSGQLEPLRSDPEDVVQKHKNVLADKASRPAKTSVSCSSLDANIASNLDIAKTKRPSLMERNATAHTFEWDSPTSQYEQSSNPTRKVNNSSSRKTSSALDETGEFILRRRKRKWNLLEEETLRKAVAEYGVGNWKFIKSRHLDIFKSRTEVDLKDKWRNMTRYS